MALRGGTRLGRNRQRRGRGGAAAAMGALAPRTWARSGACRVSAGAEGRGARTGVCAPSDRGGPLPAPRPPPAAAPHVGESPRRCASRSASAILRRATREPQPRGHPVGERGGHRRLRTWSHTGARAAPQRRARKSSHWGAGSCIPADGRCCGRRAARPPASPRVPGPPSTHPGTGTGGSFPGSSVLLALFPGGSIAACQRSQSRLRGAKREGALRGSSPPALYSVLALFSRFLARSPPKPPPQAGPDPRRRGAIAGKGSETEANK